MIPIFLAIILANMSILQILLYSLLFWTKNNSLTRFKIFSSSCFSCSDWSHISHNIGMSTQHNSTLFFLLCGASFLQTLDRVFSIFSSLLRRIMTSLQKPCTSSFLRLSVSLHIFFKKVASSNNFLI